MRKLKIILLLCSIFNFYEVAAQNPFRSLGVKDSEIKILTLSNGKYQEIITNDTLVKVGSVVINTRTSKIEYFVKTDTLYSESTLESEVISRWLSPDPVVKAYESPYAGMGNNPIMYTDPDGADNVVYLIVARNKEGKADLTPETAQSVANKANEYYKTLGVNTRVVVYDPTTSGKFNVENIDKTDNVAIIGTNRNNIVSSLKENVSPAYADYIESGTKPWSSETENPETTNRGGAYGKGNTLGIVIDYDDDFYKRFNGKLNKTEVSALSVVHGSGHNTKEVTDEGGHLFSGVMSSGTDIIWKMSNSNATLDKTILNPGFEDNKTYKKAMDNRYGGNKSTDNYSKNKNTTSRQPRYRKE